jgi:acyl-coenzyme A synthetase/AMP-(fatty) acid ligase
VTWYQPSNEISLDGETISVEALARRGLSMFAAARGTTIAVVNDDQAVLLAAVLAGRDLNMRVLVGTQERFGPETAERVAAEVDFRYEDGVLSRSKPPSPITGNEPGLLLLTSGTTGPPKLVHHDYDTINTYGGVAVEPYRWICMYEPGTYAWYQVVMLTLVVPNQTLVLPASTDIHDGYRALVDGGVTAVPSTPSMWRYLQATIPKAELAELSIRRISLGGERADQPLLDSLARLYPDAALTHLFASTETGAAIVVSDGKAGFPAAWLEQPLHGGKVWLRAKDGTLWVKSAFGHLDAAGWIDTGDAIEIEDDRVRFVGRTGERTVNVGGTSVACTTLEDVVVAQPGVIWVRAYGRPDRFVGNLVALDVVLDRSFYPDTAVAEREIATLCRERLPAAYEPRLITFLESPDLGPNQKSAMASPATEAGG